MRIALANISGLMSMAVALPTPLSSMRKRLKHRRKEAISVRCALKITENGP